MDRPLSALGCFIGWIVSTALFFGLSALLGGPSEGDAVESLYSTWAVAHGHFSCVYPLKAAHHVASIARPTTFIAPLYPLSRAPWPHFFGLVTTLLSLQLLS